MLTFKILNDPETQLLDCYNLVLNATSKLSHPGLSEEDLDREHLFYSLAEYFRGDENNRIMFGMYHEDKLVGILGAVKVPNHFFYKDQMSLETVWWVEEEYRGRDSFELIELYEQWSKEVGCRYCGMGAVNFKNDKLSKLYTRLGYHKVEENYMKDLKMEVEN